MSDPGGPAAGWYPDPAGRHHYRYWSGSAWTDYVSDGASVGGPGLPPSASMGIVPPTPERTRSGRTPMLVGAGVVVALVIAAVAFFLTRDEASSGVVDFDSTGPTAQPRAAHDGQEGDHWHAAYTVDICGEVQDPLEDGPEGDWSGIHSHGDGVIHIHPFDRSFAGEKADLGVFADTVALQVDDDRIVLPDGTTYSEGEDRCGDEEARLAVAVWASADDAADGREPSEIVTEDFDDIRFRGDREAYTIAFLPEDEAIPAPESIPSLDELSDVPG
ncbi:hypothetical protein BH18ACT4_BH18ACT4_09650 [soil metagenome]